MEVRYYYNMKVKAKDIFKNIIKPIRPWGFNRPGYKPEIKDYEMYKDRLITLILGMSISQEYNQGNHYRPAKDYFWVAFYYINGLIFTIGLAYVTISFLQYLTDKIFK